MASSSSSSPQVNCVYDVFLSFRGEDVRVKFRSHFLKELDRKLITFKDNEIEKGKPIGPELLNAIRRSRMSIVAFSENFANSSWCLDELVEIMKCNKEMGKIVIPIFYGVEPSHVKKQTESFGETFNKTCKDIPEENILQWRKALFEAATKAGVDSRDWPDEAKMIEEIASDVSNKLNSTSSNDFDDCVGIKSHMRKMDFLLEWESEEVIMVGIWGQSGVGKTTIGRALFSRLSMEYQMDGNKKFQGSIFIDKTKDIYRSANSGDYNMKLHLQRQFLSEILDEKDIKIYSLSAVKERLGHKKVLVVFDDVDDQVLLQALVGHTSWFGSGSRIVVISKDRELLRASGIESHRIYQVALPSQELAFQMFCQCAFGQDSPDDGFMELAIDAANLTGNLPLALNVLGSSLAGMKKEEWADRLPKLRDGMAGTVDKTYKDSYDRLKEEEKEIFRHIACLFNHKTQDYVIRLLEDRLDVRAGLTTLVERCLINISADKIIRMHDFLQKMGRDIVRPPCTREPGKCQFLMDSKDIYDVLVAGTGTNGVLGIFLNLSEIEDGLHIREKAFRKMQNLRFLSMYGVLQKDKEVMLHLQGGKYGMWFLPQKEEDQMWRQLRLLEWWGCSMRCMPSNFYAKNLVELRMPDSHLEKLWEGAQVLKNLKKMDLRRSKKLKEFPDLSKATNLEELYFEDCWSLVKIPSSIQNLNQLRKLDMKRCKNLQVLPTNINLESLYSLNLSGCSRLRSFPQISRNISYLFLDETEIEEVPAEIEDISGLNYLLMNGCSKLNYISPNISKLKHLEVIFFSSSDSLIRESCYESPSAVSITTDNIPTQLPDASSSRNRMKDVFLNFRGSDVRRTFISYLYMKLKSMSITTYMEEEIEFGSNIIDVYMDGLRGSRMAVVVLSKHYFSSRWCLDELVEIMRLKEDLGQKVIPIFYHVDPSYITNQIIELGKNNTVDKQLKRVQALTKLNQLHGYRLEKGESEEEIIEKVVGDIIELTRAPPNAIPGVDEFKDQMAKMKLLICLESEEVRMFGVWGPWIGKTTIMKALFSQLTCQFKISGFIDGKWLSKTVKQYKSDNLDINNIKLHLQKQFLSRIENIDHLSVDMKVLIFIDDVGYDQDVLDALVGQGQLFGRGSRIILITEDKQFLRAHGIESIYEVVFPSQEVSLEIFCLQASPPDGYRKLAVEFAKLMGSCIQCLPGIHKNVDQELEKKSLVLYDSLNGKAKALFRHIACFLNNETYAKVMRLLEDSELDVGVSLKILLDKSLIQISEERVISMHHVLQKLGREIVLGPFIHHHAKRQFLMDTMEGCDILIDENGTEHVLGISFKESGMLRTLGRDERLKKLKNLYTKRMYKERLYGKEVNVHLVGGLHRMWHHLNNT